MGHADSKGRFFLKEISLLTMMRKETDEILVLSLNRWMTKTRLVLRTNPEMAVNR